MKKQNLYNANWMEKQKSKGLCIFCRTKRLEHSALCEKHFFTSKATSLLKDIKMAEIIRDIFYAQNGICYLTGEKLILGLNASLDHIIPTSKKPDLISEPSNLKWCTQEANFLKRDMDFDKLIIFCRSLLENVKYQQTNTKPV